MADILQITLSINNQDAIASSDPIRITNAHPVLNWTFSPGAILNIDEYTSKFIGSILADQRGFEVRISNDDIDWGNENFTGDRVHTGFLSSQDRFWNYSGVPLDRGNIYYGQIQIEDELDRLSSWITFSIHFNSLPVISNLNISPAQPFVIDDLKLTYTFSDADNDTEKGTVIRWFKNGTRQRQFDNVSTVGSEFLEIGDIWSANALPGDGFENGVRTSSPIVEVIKAEVLARDVEVLPRNPNENDIFQASYKTNNPLEEDVATIRWFANDVLQSQFNDQIFARLPVSVEDKVRFEVRTNNGDLFTSSSEATIGVSPFVVYDILVDGKKNSFEVSSLGPAISWKVFEPEGKNVNYINIKIGTFFEADNVFSAVEKSNRNIFTVPPNTLQQGRDYFVSVGVSDTNSFEKFTSTHFRVIGSRWERAVSNSIGWTIETTFLLEDVVPFNEDLYQVLRISDGSYFAEVRIYNEKIGFVSDGLKLSNNVDTIGAKILTIVGQGKDIKIYLNRKIVLDATGLFVRPTTTKRLEIGNVTGEDFVVRYKFFHYTVSGRFSPGASTQFSNLKFHDFLEFDRSEVVGLKGFTRNLEDFKVFGVNPDDVEESGAVYGIVPGNPFRASTVNRTFAPINKVRQSPDKKKIAVAHSQGVSVITGYVINRYSEELPFVDSNGIIDDEMFPNNNGWHLVQNTRQVSGFFDINGFTINTIKGQ